MWIVQNSKFKKSILVLMITTFLWSSAFFVPYKTAHANPLLIPALIKAGEIVAVSTAIIAGGLIATNPQSLEVITADLKQRWLDAGKYDLWTQLTTIRDGFISFTPEIAKEIMEYLRTQLGITSLKEGQLVNYYLENYLGNITYANTGSTNSTGYYIPLITSGLINYNIHKSTLVAGSTLYLKHQFLYTRSDGSTGSVRFEWDTDIWDSPFDRYPVLQIIIDNVTYKVVNYTRFGLTSDPIIINEISADNDELQLISNGEIVFSSFRDGFTFTDIKHQQIGPFWASYGSGIHEFGYSGTYEYTPTFNDWTFNDNPTKDKDLENYKVGIPTVTETASDGTTSTRAAEKAEDFVGTKEEDLTYVNTATGEIVTPPPKAQNPQFPFWAFGLLFLDLLRAVLFYLVRLFEFLLTLPFIDAISPQDPDIYHGTMWFKNLKLGGISVFNSVISLVIVALGMITYKIVKRL